MTPMPIINSEKRTMRPVSILPMSRLQQISRNSNLILVIVAHTSLVRIRCKGLNDPVRLVSAHGFVEVEQRALLLQPGEERFLGGWRRAVS